MYLDLVLVCIAVHLAHSVPDSATSTLDTCLKRLESSANTCVLVPLSKENLHLRFLLRPKSLLNFCHILYFDHATSLACSNYTIIQNRGHQPMELNHQRAKENDLPKENVFEYSCCITETLLFGRRASFEAASKRDRSGIADTLD